MQADQQPSVTTVLINPLVLMRFYKAIFPLRQNERMFNFKHATELIKSRAI